METEATQLSARDQHLASESAGKSPEQALVTLTAEPVSRTQNGAEAILDLLRTNGTDCVFASPIATMAPLWEALAARRERGEPEAPRYFHCRHEMLAVAAACPITSHHCSTAVHRGLVRFCSSRTASHRKPKA